MLSTELARRFIERISEYTDYNVNIMNADGVIIASRDPERIGSYHEIADRIVHGHEDVVYVSEGEHYRGVQPGINMLIESDGAREGAVGVTGDPEVIRPVAMIVKMAIETFIKYENQQEELYRRQNKKVLFMSLLTQAPTTDAAEINRLADELGYPEDRVRIPILIRLEGMPEPQVEELLEVIKHSAHHTASDVSLQLDDGHIIIFKVIADTQQMLGDYQYVIGEYLSPALRWLQEHDLSGVRFYIGSFQETYSQYYYAYRHCKWLEEHVHSDARAVFFYDHVREYLVETVPLGEMDRIFHSVEERLPDRHYAQFMDMMPALIASNYNFGKAAEALYIHKNTLVYRYNQMKAALDVDPLRNAGDRAFLEYYYYYLCRRHNK